MLLVGDTWREVPTPMPLAWPSCLLAFCGTQAGPTCAQIPMNILKTPHEHGLQNDAAK